MLPADLKSRLRVYAIVDSKVTDECVRALGAGGVTALQLRDKTAPAAQVIGRGRELARLCRELNLLFIVNDRPEWQPLLPADGVHLGQADGYAAARSALPASVVLGVSVATPEQAQRAVAAGADYLGVGPIFSTASKSDAGAAIGLAGLEAVRRAEPKALLVAIGGISLDNASQVLAAGADGLAMITALSSVADPRAAARAFARKLF